MKSKHLIPVCLLLAIPSIAQETHIVQRGEVLSEIILKKRPSRTIPLYGGGGRLQQILALNPELRNANRIYPNQVIVLNDVNETAPEENVSLEVNPEIAPDLPPELEPEVLMSKEEETAPEEIMSTEKKIGKWDISAHYGIKAVSYEQKNTLGNSDVSALFPSYYQLNAEYTHNDWAGWLNYNSFKLNYESGNYTQSRQIKSYEAGASYKNYLVSIGVDEMPLFRRTATRVEMSKYNFVNLAIGWRDEWTYKSSLFAFKSWLKYPISAQSEKSQVDLSSPTGFKVKGQLQWQYPIYQTPNYQLFADWQNDLSYQQSKVNVEWEAQNGSVNSNIIEYGTSIGLHVKF